MKIFSVILGKAKTTHSKPGPTEKLERQINALKPMLQNPKLAKNTVSLYILTL